MYLNSFIVDSANEITGLVLVVNPWCRTMHTLQKWTYTLRESHDVKEIALKTYSFWLLNAVSK